ncbi:hypothetical protein QW131_16935 [Roseibium salinum]|nr:hypothetical protein [Roseibium salinum]
MAKSRIASCLPVVNEDLGKSECIQERCNHGQSRKLRSARISQPLRFAAEKKTWSDYNKGWTTRRANALKQTQQLRNIANNFSNISIHSSQANTVFVMQNQSQLGAYASPTAVMSRINVVV